MASKVFIDQVLWNPIFGVMFFSYVAALEGKGPQYRWTRRRGAAHFGEPG